MLGFSSRADAEARLLKSLTGLVSDWPRESSKGFMVHFTNRDLQETMAIRNMRIEKYFPEQGCAF